MSWPLPSRVCELYGIEIPIVQSGMGGIAGPELAAAVSNAGGLGILAGHTVPIDDLRERIAKLRSLTGKPFGVNLLIPDDLAHPAEASSIPEGTAEAVQTAINQVRRSLHLPEKGGLPATPPADLRAKLEMLLEERIPVLSFGLGDPGPELVAECHRLGIRTMAMVSTVEDAVAVERSGIDAVVAQGGEAGGHRSHFSKPAAPNKGLVGTMVLIPAVRDAVKIPVIAAGGIADGRGVAASIALGADGVMIGTRFVASQESMAVSAYKDALLEAGSNDSVISDAASGRYARLIDNELLRLYRESADTTLPFMWQASAISDVLDEARAKNDGRFLALWAGQAAGLIDDLPAASDIVRRIVDETTNVLARLAGQE